MLSTIIFILVILHLVAGFGYLIYKLSPTKKVIEQDLDNDNKNIHN